MPEIRSRFKKNGVLLERRSLPICHISHGSKQSDGKASDSSRRTMRSWSWVVTVWIPQHRKKQVVLYVWRVQMWAEELCEADAADQQFYCPLVSGFLSPGSKDRRHICSMSHCWRKHHFLSDVGSMKLLLKASHECLRLVNQMIVLKHLAVKSQKSCCSQTNGTTSWSCISSAELKAASLNHWTLLTLNFSKCLQLK